MNFPEQLYSLSPRDRRGTQLDMLLRAAGSVSLANVFVADDEIIPDGKVLILESAVADAQPGAAQTVALLVLALMPPALGAAVAFAAREFDPVTGNRRFLNWTGQLLVPPDWSVRAFASFSAGAVANTVSLSFAGVLIPVGNIARV